MYICRPALQINGYKTSLTLWTLARLRHWTLDRGGEGGAASPLAFGEPSKNVQQNDPLPQPQSDIALSVMHSLVMRYLPNAHLIFKSFSCGCFIFN